MQRRWALGGGIASGKSQVRRFLEEYDILVIDADSIGHQVLEPEKAAFAEVSVRWPSVVEDGVIDRRRLGEIVFGDPEELTVLEAMTHPHIFDIIRAEVEKVGVGVVVELPVPGWRLGNEWLQMVVDSRKELRVQRAVNRGSSEKDVQARMAVQPNRQEWLAIADLVVPNHGPLEELADTVHALLNSGQL